MADKTTLADYLAELGVDVNNMQEFLNKLSQMLTTNSDTVAINQTLQDGTSKIFNVPSFAYLSNKVNALDTKFNSLLSGNENRIGVKDATGQLKTFELQDLSAVISDLDSVASKTIESPVAFNYKTNWFFESFLNPLIYIELPVDSIVTSDIDKFEVLRVIITSQVAADLTYFDSTYKGKNAIVYSDLIKDLGTRAISYFEDTNEISLPPAQNTKYGSFDITKLLSDSESKVVANVAVVTNVTKYVLSTLLYTEKSQGSPNGVVQKTLKVGDRLLTSDNSEYVVTNVDVNQRSITVNRTFGLGELAQGADVLRIKPELVPSTSLPINLGYNERQVLFLKPSSTRLKVTTDKYSQGIGIFSNELSITLTNGTAMTLADFYKKFVSDFGLLFLNYAKEKKLPSALGETPNAVVLDTANFKVVQTDLHIQADNDISEIKQNISSIEAVKSQIREVDKQISEKRAELNTNSALSEAQSLRLTRDLLGLSDDRKTLSTQHASKISSVTTAVKATPQLIKVPTYKVKGFWAVPEPKDAAHGLQEVVQFKISYRVLSKTGTSEPAEQITFTDAKGNKITGSFSPWKEIITKPRVKKYNALTGFYEWQEEKIADPNEVNSNQLELPINKGEVLEIRVKSLSEAGWPDTPAESEYSNVILIEFPANIQTIEDISVVSQQAFAEEAKINFQDELNSKGLDIHLGTSFTSRDKYFAHRAEDVASGFFSSDGSIVDLFTKLKTISDSLTAVQTSIASGTGQLKVSIIDQTGNQVSVANGQTVQIFAGYYKDQIKNSSGSSVSYDWGKVITNQYYIQVENTSQTPLQIISALTGGLGQKAPVSNPAVSPTEAYHTSLRYDSAPIGIADVSAGLIADTRQTDGYQSSQVQGQIVYRRTKSVNLAEKLVEGDRRQITGLDPENISYDLTLSGGNYNYQGTVIGSTTMPYVAGHYVPYNPTVGGLSILINGVSISFSPNATIWNGQIDANSAPRGNGLLSEFCISIDHPDIKVGGKYNAAWGSIYRPVYTAGATKQITLPFSQAIHCEISTAESTNPFGAKYTQQAAYNTPTIPSTLVTTAAAMREQNYPIKLGFSENDKYLIGKYTCGAYLYIAPASYESIGATSFSPSAAKRIVNYGTESSIKIPLTFQYRCADYLKYVGGYRGNATTGLRNVKYTKKIGFDINLSTEVFSFDVLVSAQFEKETAVITPATAIAQTATVSSAALNA